MKNVMDTLRERGFIKQVVFEEDLYKLLGSESVSFYIGFDPTADSLHVGHYLAMMAMAHMQRAGHKPIVLIGGGTALIGDPSGRTDMRKMMTKETVQENVNAIKHQMEKFFTFEGDNGARIINNADWLWGLNYIDFIRDIGSMLSVNKMLTAECFKTRMEKGLSFLEFNYMPMQAYDFLYLFQNYGCVLECGGDDQWSNMLAGADLIRRKERKDAFAMTFQLLTTSEGKKMGKTQAGALWLDRNKTSPYEFYQYWRNVSDDDVEKCLNLLTFLPLEEISDLVQYRDERINRAKERLAFEVTKIVHSEQDAIEAEKQAKAAFSGDSSNMPTAVIPQGMKLVADILVETKIAGSKSEAKRLIADNAVSINDRKASGFDAVVTDEELQAGFVLHKGKKIHVKITVE